MAPLLLWLCIDLVRFRHFDALSAIVLAGIVMSLCLLALRPAHSLDAQRGACRPAPIC
ncbi:hypothetical protein [Caballeronia catudaia]|uniref:hypothetical protein n=1 Tax=Caballeronia catudaia TaxID=1777136 RepID=UPI000A6520CF|nr:hypothetical protein [Caballeronia catudaia]